MSILVACSSRHGATRQISERMKDAAGFVRTHQELLAQRPVWLFTSGPLGNEAPDATGVDPRTAAEPRELPEFREIIHPREHCVFYGVLDPDKLNFAERSLRKLPAARATLPEGDFRDWDEIQQWAYQIAKEMEMPVGRGGAPPGSFIPNSNGEGGRVISSGDSYSS